MSREWKSGDVATIGTRPLLYIGGGRWADSFGYQLPLTAEEPRPLVVIDPDDREAVERLADYLDSAYSLEYAQQRLREYANPKPPKPDEPQGLGAVVEDEDGSLLIRNAPTGSRPWVTMHGATFDWSEIAAVRVLSPGVEVDQ